MNHRELLHILRAAQAISNESSLLVIGSQSIFGKFPDAPHSVRDSLEADVATPANPSKSELIDGTIGECSRFHDTFGVYAHGIVKETATLPPDWETRAISKTFNEVPGATVVFLHPDDAVFSKLAAGREKDFDWVKDVFKHHLSNQGSVARLILECKDEELKKKLERNFHVSTGRPPESVLSRRLSIKGLSSNIISREPKTDEPVLDEQSVQAHLPPHISDNQIEGR